MIEFKQVSYSTGTETPEPFSVKLANGHTYGILGDRFEGSSLFLSLLSGKRMPASGDVRINGFSMKWEAARAKKCMASLPLSMSLFEELTVLESLSFVADAYGIGYEKTLRRISHLLDEWGMDQKRHVTVKKLNASERTTLSYLLLLLPEPEIVLLDLTAPSDTHNTKHDLAELFGALPDGTTVFLAEKSPAALQGICEQILLFENGVFQGIAAPDDTRVAEWQGSADESDGLSIPGHHTEIRTTLFEGVKEEFLEEEEG